MKSFLAFIILLSVCYANGQTSLPASLRSSHTVLSKSNNLPPGVEGDWYSNAVQKIEKSQYSFYSSKKKTSEIHAYNNRNKLFFIINASGYTVENNKIENQSAWKARFTINGIGRKTPEPVYNTKYTIENKENILKFVSRDHDIEYINNAEGLRQNFILKTKPEGNGFVKVNIGLDNSLKYKLDKQGNLMCYQYTDVQNPVLIYDGLKVWDANGKILYAKMVMENHVLSILADDKDATYPITIDPLNHVPEWTTSADGVLPALLTNLQLQVDALYGYSVAGLGDVNGDGFDDVAIGAPGAIDVIAGPSTIVGAGAVFVYFGSATGLSTTPDKVLRATTPVTNALFGFSIAAGNITGNSRNDIIVGAPGESYLANVGGVPNTATIAAGRVYVFRGEDLSSPNPAPLLSVYLNGSGLFSNGVFGLVGSNVNAKVLFGFSVAATEDMNGDGLGELLVGAPGYAGLELLPVRSGAAFVYYSNNLVANNPVRLTAPSATLLGIPLLTNEGLLFGYSVDGLGDYNLDGNADIVVGAPGGVSLDLGNFLGGSAYIYNGNGSGVSTTHSTQLKASPSLISTAANLFGYSVAGVRNANGSRNGNVLAGAPVQNILSNVIGGLRLKAGTINLFRKTASVLSERTPEQVIPSPRGNSLLSILAGQTLNVSALFGADIDNMLDVNCDGINDIIVGEPLSTSVGIINANAVGGAAHIFLGNADGTYNPAVHWSLTNSVSFNAGVNAGSLLGYSVAGARHVRGPLQGVRALVGAPGAALDFSSGIFNLSNTLGTLFSFVAGDNGLGKAYMFAFNNCGVKYNPDVNVTYINVTVPGDVSANDIVPGGSSYGTPVPSPSNPGGATINMNPDGSYTFTAVTPGVYFYNVPVCLPAEPDPCTLVELKITVLSTGATNPPVANTDIASTQSGTAVTINSLSNDKCFGIGCSLNPASVTILNGPANGMATVNPANGDITYTPSPGFMGNDTLIYQVCDNGSPALCASAMQVITVYPPTVENTTLAADDYFSTYTGQPVFGNVKLNDTDAEGDEQVVQAQVTSIPGKGTLTLNADGSFEFSPATGFAGPVSFEYTTCDDGNPSVCATATLYIMVIGLVTVPVTLTDFHHQVKDCAVLLSWKTANEINAKQFVIEHSINSVDWKAVSSITAKGAANTISSYNFNHPSPAGYQNYYRLAMHDKDGSISYSAVINAVVNCSKTVITTRPNPFTDKIQVYMAGAIAGPVVITLFDNTGKQLLKQQYIAITGANQFELSGLEKFGKGLFILSIRSGETILNQKIIK